MSSKQAKGQNNGRKREIRLGQGRGGGEKRRGGAMKEEKRKKMSFRFVSNIKI
jgi:hypothetical protein